MFQLIRNHPKITQTLLGLFTLPFLFFGMQSYENRSSVGDAIAKVGGSKITQQDFQKALQKQQERLREALGSAYQPDMLKKPEVHQAVLDSLVNQRLLALYSIHSRVTITNAELRQVIGSIPAFQEDGRFSPTRYSAYVASQYMSEPQFEERLRQDVDVQQIASAVQGSTIVSKTTASRWIAALQQKRVVSEAPFAPAKFAAQVTLAPDAVKNYYQANLSQFQKPARVRAEYLVLSPKTLAAQVKVSDADIKNWYQDHEASYRQPQERRASHILIRVAKNAPAAKVKAAKAKAEAIEAQLKAHPGEFAELAKKDSQDPGSAKNGGDLGWFSRGTMVKPFDDEVFSLKQGQISPVIRSDFGFHIIKLTGIRGGEVKPLAAVRDQIVAAVTSQKATTLYDADAEAFSNTVYEQADSLKPAADKYKLKIQQSEWIDKGGKVAGILGNAKLQEALFSDDAIKHKHNTDAIEVAPNTLVSARVTDFKPAAVQPLATVKSQIEKRLIHDEAAKLARKAGQAALAKLTKGNTDNLSWSKPKDITRLKAPGIAPQALDAIYRADVSHLPAYVGVDLADGSYVCYRISQVKPFVPGKTEDAVSKELHEQYDQVIADAQWSAWLAALRLRYPVKVNEKLLRSTEP